MLWIFINLLRDPSSITFNTDPGLQNQVPSKLIATRAVNVMKQGMESWRTKYANSLKKYEANKNICRIGFIEFLNGESLLIYIRTVAEKHPVFDKVFLRLLIKGSGVSYTIYLNEPTDIKV